MSGMSASSDWQSLRQRISDLIDAGQNEAVEVALSDHVDLQADEHLVLKCIDWEVSSRASRGQTPEISEYLRRFPGHAPRLSSRWLNHLSRIGQTLDPSDFGDQANAEIRPQSDESDAGSKHPERRSSEPRKSEAIHSAEPPTDFSQIRDQLLQLYEQGLLTDFQAEQVASGHVKSLILGGYTILDRIGAGGMGEVFKAEHRRMSRIVAIKTLSPAVTQDAETTARFEREARLAAKLLHNNIVTAFDADQFNGVRFLVMEYVEGQDLAALAEQIGPLPPAVALNYVLQAARGLECAHSEGVIHRDIKPANLLLDKKGVVKILDMGIARIQVARNATMRSELTLQGDVFGTVEFMSPEQSFDTKNVDGRSDIYSLGCTLYYLISGRPMFDGETVLEKILAHRERPIPSLRAFDASIPSEIDVLFRKMVAKRLQDRFPSTTELVASLSKFSRGEALPADQIQNHRHTRIAVSGVGKRKPLFRASAAILLIFAGAASVVWFVKPDHGLIPPVKKHESPDSLTLSQTVESTPTTALETSVPFVTAEQSRQQMATTVDEVLEPTFNSLVDAEADIVNESQTPTDVARMTVPNEDVAVSDDNSIDTNFESPPETTSEPQPEKPEPGPSKTESEVATIEKPATPKSKDPDSGWITTDQKSAIERANIFLQWAKHAATRPPEEQLQVVTERLRELNPKFDGRETHHIKLGVVTELQFISDDVTDISPIHALAGLKTLNCSGTDVRRGRIADLTSLRGMSLIVLNIENTQVSDLSPLQGMKLSSLNCSGTSVSSLKPLKGMALNELRCARTQVVDLTPLKGMAITHLDCSHTEVISLLPLRGYGNLKTLNVRSTNVNLTDIAAIYIEHPDCVVDRDSSTKHEPPPPPVPQP
jgi:serine/threonine protein kinase